MMTFAADVEQRVHAKHPSYNMLMTELVDFVSFGQRQVQASRFTVAFSLHEAGSARRLLAEGFYLSYRQRGTNLPIDS